MYIVSVHWRRPGQWSDADLSLAAWHPSWLLIGQSEMELEAGEASAGNGEIKQWRLLASRKVLLFLQKCICETFLTQTFPFQ